jgi:hypothetical protein
LPGARSTFHGLQTAPAGHDMSLAYVAFSYISIVFFVSKAHDTTSPSRHRNAELGES